MIRLEDVYGYEYPLELELNDSMEYHISEKLRWSVMAVFSGSFILPGDTWLSGSIWNPNCRTITEDELVGDDGK